jgi:hypothetical protein
MQLLRPSGPPPGKLIPELPPVVAVVVASGCGSAAMGCSSVAGAPITAAGVGVGAAGGLATLSEGAFAAGVAAAAGATKAAAAFTVADFAVNGRAALLTRPCEWPPLASATFGS